jgi:radical SAM protein with 4Fe4S-binding SPASM domain
MNWQSDWGPRPRRRVRPFWWPPTLMLRQFLSTLYLGALTHWRALPSWLLRYGIKCLPGVAGAQGMGCIGFPAHPVWEMTTACNLRCIHCHVSGGQSQSDELSTSEAKNLFSQLADIPEFRMLAFTGGEPLLREDLYELLAYSQALGFTNTIATNATLITDKVAQQLRHYGVVIAAVSLDAVDPATHDRIRGVPGAFQAAMKGMAALRRAGILLHINITAMEYNLQQIQALSTLIDKLDTSILLMYQLVPVGRGERIKSAVLDSHTTEHLIHHIAAAQHCSRAIYEPVASPQYWPYLLARAQITGGIRLRLAQWLFHGCAAGRGFVYIKPNGDVWPCPFIERSCGNIREHAFHSIWTASPLFTALRSRETTLQGRCGRCRYRQLCGGCRARGGTHMSDYLAEDPLCFLEA